MNQGKAVQIKCPFRAAWIFILKVSGQESTRDCLAAVGRTNLQKQVLTKQQSGLLTQSYPILSLKTILEYTFEITLTSYILSWYRRLLLPLLLKEEPKSKWIIL
jgi:hypothetical protein